MSRISFIAFILSVFTLVNSVSEISHESKVALGVLAFVCSTYYFALDLFLFARNPYGFWQKAADLLLSSLLGPVYEDKKSKWSIQDKINVYCNQIVSDQVITNKSIYMILIEDKSEGGQIAESHNDDHPWVLFPNSVEGGHEKRRLNTFGDKRKFDENEVRTIFKNEWNIWLSIRSDKGDWCNEIAWESFTPPGYNGEKEFLSKVFRADLWGRCKSALIVFNSYSVKNFQVTVKAKVPKGEGTIVVDCIMFERGNSIAVKSYEKIYCNNTNSLFNVFSMWDYLSKNPEIGLISSVKGGKGRRGWRVLHSMNIGESLELIRTGKFNLKICQHEVGGFMIAGDGVDKPGQEDKNRKLGLIDKRLIRSFFSTESAYKSISSYLKLRYGTRSEEIMKEYVEHPSPVRFNNEILNNWQVKRMFSDLKYIFKALNLSYRVYTPRGIPPTRECRAILNRILEGEVEKKVSQEIKKGNLQEDEGSFKGIVEAIEAESIEMICNNEIELYHNSNLIKDLGRGEGSITRLSSRLTKKGGSRFISFNDMTAVEGHLERLRGCNRMDKDVQFAKTFKSALMSKPSCKLISMLKKQDAEEEMHRKKKEEEIREKSGAFATELKRRMAITARSILDRVIKTCKERKVLDDDQEGFITVKGRPKPKQLRGFEIELKNMYEHIPNIEDSADFDPSPFEELIINNIVTSKQRSYKMDKVKNEEDRMKEVLANDSVTDKRIVIVKKVYIKKNDKLIKNKCEIDLDNMVELLSKYKCEREFLKSKVGRGGKLKAFDINNEADCIKYIYHRGKKGFKLGNNKLRKSILMELNQQIGLQKVNRKTVTDLDLLTNGAYSDCLDSVLNLKRLSSRIEDEVNMELQRKKELEEARKVKAEKERIEEERLNKIRLEAEQRDMEGRLRDLEINEGGGAVNKLAITFFEKASDVINIKKYLDSTQEGSVEHKNGGHTQAGAGSGKDKVTEARNEKKAWRKNKKSAVKPTKEERAKKHESDGERAFFKGQYSFF